MKPVGGRSQYPDVVVEAQTANCDFREYLENPCVMHIGPKYCPKHSVIVLRGVFLPDDLEAIPEVAVYLINHETLYWILCKHFGETISLSLDETLSIAPFI